MKSPWPDRDTTNVKIFNGEVYIYDNKGNEIVMWSREEWEEDPDLIAIINSVIDDVEEGKIDEIKQVLGYSAPMSKLKPYIFQFGTWFVGGTIGFGVASFASNFLPGENTLIRKVAMVASGIVLTVVATIAVRKILTRQQVVRFGAGDSKFKVGDEVVCQRHDVKRRTESIHVGERYIVTDVLDDGKKLMVRKKGYERVTGPWGYWSFVDGNKEFWTYDDSETPPEWNTDGISLRIVDKEDGYGIQYQFDGEKWMDYDHRYLDSIVLDIDDEEWKDKKKVIAALKKWIDENPIVYIENSCPVCGGEVYCEGAEPDVGIQGGCVCEWCGAEVFPEPPEY